MAYEAKFDGMAHVADITRQFQNVRKYLYNSEKGLNYHAYDEARVQFWADKETGCSKNFWLRSTGWYLMALVDCIALCSEQLYEHYRALVDIFRESIRGVLPYRAADGLFYQVIDHPEAEGNYTETSGSAMIAYSLLKGVRIGVLDAEKISGMEELLKFVFLLAFVGFGTKAAVFPMYAWLPAASVAPTPVTALLHAVAVVNAGAYAVLRVIYYSFGASFLYGTWAQTVALLLSCFTILFGSTMAVREQHFKRRLAYSTISNLSYMLMGAALMTPDGMTGSLSHLVIHGVIKITLFYCAGAILIKTGKEYVQDLRGYSRIMPATCGIFLLGSIALVGTPPLAGFVSKWNLLTAASATGLPMGTVAIVCLIISAILTAIYLFTAALPMYFRPLNADQAQLAGQKLDPSWMMLLPMGILCALMIGLGLWSQPLVTFLRNISAGVIF